MFDKVLNTPLFRKSLKQTNQNSSYKSVLETFKKNLNQDLQGNQITYLQS